MLYKLDDYLIRMQDPSHSSQLITNRRIRKIEKSDY
jgi:hypothetical protein